MGRGLKTGASLIAKFAPSDFGFIGGTTNPLHICLEGDEGESFPHLLL